MLPKGPKDCIQGLGTGNSLYPDVSLAQEAKRSEVGEANIAIPDHLNSTGEESSPYGCHLHSIDFSSRQVWPFQHI